jgi:hypothetical protein
MANDPNAFTNMWMTNPYMFEPSQLSNQFSNYNDQAMPWPPTYNTGAGGPVNAATGQPIQSYQNWAAANPGGLSINSTPAAPQGNAGALGVGSPQQQNAARIWQAAQGAGQGSYMNALTNQGMAPWQMGGGMGGAGGAGGGAGGQGGGSSPNNWQQAINSLSNPGNPVTPGATVPLASGSQPAGGVNNAFLQNAGAGQGMNQNFLSALRAIQGRPQ